MCSRNALYKSTFYLLTYNVIANLKRGKAIDFDGLSAEHLQYSHPSLCVVLSKLIQLMMLCSIVPEGFKRSYIVPIPKPKEVYIANL